MHIASVVEGKYLLRTEAISTLVHRAVLVEAFAPTLLPQLQPLGLLTRRALIAFLCRRLLFFWRAVLRQRIEFGHISEHFLINELIEK